jgi:peptide chain release factor 1
MTWPRSVSRKDLKIEYMRGSGKGGQNRHKRDTTCRITHIPTGIAIRADEGRSQEINREIAFKRLAEKLVPLMKEAILGRQDDKERPTERIRTYNADRNEVVDHRSGKRAPMERVLAGDLDGLTPDAD